MKNIKLNAFFSQRTCSKKLNMQSKCESIENFEQLVEEVIEELPKRLRNTVRNLGVLVEEEPSDDLLLELGHDPNEHLLGLYVGVPFPERTFGIERKLYPNVDFYSGIIYQAMGFPVELYPVLFAIGRTCGWIAQWQEMLLDAEQKIARPRQIYLGEEQRDCIPVDRRNS
ncbi:MAG: citrate/2-methylcitrate synthase [bacterium]